MTEYMHNSVPTKTWSGYGQALHMHMHMLNMLTQPSRPSRSPGPLKHSPCGRGAPPAAVIVVICLHTSPERTGSP